MENGKMKEEKLLVQLWCGNDEGIESQHTRQVWEDIAQEISKFRKVTSAQSQQKMKYLKGWYKKAKDHNCHKTGGEQTISPFYDEIDSLLGCGDIWLHRRICDRIFFSSSNSNGKEGKP